MAFDASTYLDQAASLVGLEIDEACRPGVIENLERLAAVARQVAEFPLPDDVEAAPVFTA
ncbi:MAG: DUF4089 domain-containing protein [Ferrovibrionaceae bacterium]